MTATTPSLHPTAAAAAAAPLRRVTDAPTRLAHALLALGFLGAYLTAESERWRALHATLGYLCAGAVAFRLLYGLFGPRHARLSLLWRRLAGALRGLQLATRTASLGDVPWNAARNAALAATLVGVLALVIPLALSGHATMHEWGTAIGLPVLDEGLEELHEGAADTVLALVVAHVGLIGLLSALRRRNQALPMLTGRVAGPGPDLVRDDRRGLAAVLAIAAVAFVAWQWQASPRGLVPLRGAAAPPALQAPTARDDGAHGPGEGLGDRTAAGRSRGDYTAAVAAVADRRPRQTL